MSPSAFYYYKWLGGWAEYTRTTQAVSNTTTSRTNDVSNTAWEVTGSAVLTGEPVSERGVVPTHRFEPSMHEWGAVQMVVRYSRLTVDPDAFAEGLAAEHASHSASATGVSVNWYFSSHVKYILSFERTVFDEDPKARRAPEHALILRVQFNLQPSL